MVEETTRTLFVHALERLRNEMLTSLERADIAADSPIRYNILRALADMRGRLEADPEWVEDMLNHLPTLLDAPHEHNASDKRGDH